MPSELDFRLASVVADLTAPGTPFEVGFFERDGIRLPFFSQAPRTLPELFDRYCTVHRDAEFLIDGDLRLSFAQVHALARRVAAGLVTRHGVRRGEHVGIAARNSANWIIAYMGVLMAGGCATLLNGWWTSEELTGGIALADCTLVLADPQRAARLSETPMIARVALFDHGSPEEGLAGLFGADNDAWRLPALTGDDLATILFTSGSTGMAKGAMSDHRAVVQAAVSFGVMSLSVFLAQTPEGERPQPQSTLLSVPLFHVSGEISLLLASFVTGRRLVIMPRWDALDAMRLIEREKVTFFNGVPLMSHEIAMHPARHRFDLSSCSIFVAGGAPRPADHLGQFIEALPHAAPMFGYGLTETNCTGCANFGENYVARPGSSGPSGSPLVEIAVIAPGGEVLPAGIHGEVAVRTVCMMRGYWRNPQETEASLRGDGFFLTGDLGYVDDDGYLFVVDRKKDIIIRGGENIASAEVEQAIYAHPGVAEAVVFGLPHDRYGEVPVAVYAIKDGHRLNEDELRQHVADRIAAFKVPVRLWREEAALPRLGTEKIDRRGLKARYSQAWEAAKGAL